MKHFTSASWYGSHWRARTYAKEMNATHVYVLYIYKLCCCSNPGTIRYPNYPVNKLNELIKETLNHHPLDTFIKLKAKPIDQDSANINISKIYKLCKIIYKKTYFKQIFDNIWQFTFPRYILSIHFFIYTYIVALINFVNL